MTLKLFHYVHCPFCVRVRMTLGYLGLEYQSVVLSYDDEKTPMELAGKKMLPIMTIGKKVMNESLDIMAELDQENVLRVQNLRTGEGFKKFETLLTEIGGPVHSLAMPFWIWSPEFKESARNYFRAKKEAKRGPFQELVKNQTRFVNEIQPILKKLENDLTPFYQSETFSVKDILLAAHLWGLYSVPEFRFTEKIHSYLQSVKSTCQFNYQQPLWEQF